MWCTTFGRGAESVVIANTLKEMISRWKHTMSRYLVRRAVENHCFPGPAFYRTTNLDIVLTSC